MAHDEAHRTREKIMEEARKLFADKGYWGTSVQEITDAAHVNKAMLFYYFKSKENLYFDIIDDIMTSTREKMQSMLRTKKGAMEKLAYILNSFDDLFCDPRTFSTNKIIFQDIIGPCDRIKSSLKEHVNSHKSLIAGIIDEGKAEGVFRDVDSHYVALSIMGMFFVFARHKIMLGEMYDTGGIGSFIQTIIMEGIHR